MNLKLEVQYGQDEEGFWMTATTNHLGHEETTQQARLKATDWEAARAEVEHVTGCLLIAAGLDLREAS